MKLWITSDLHSDHSPWRPDYVPGHDVMIVAGDICDDRENALIELVNLHSRSRKPIVFVPGNHDLFGGPLDAFDGEQRLLLAQDIHVLSSGQSIVIDGVRFVGATLWTDWLLGDREWAAQSWAARSMPEFSHVTRADGDLIWPIDLSDQHDLHRGAIGRTLTRRHEEPTVVVTHHAPSARSLRPGEERSVEAAAYASDLEQVMTMHGPDLWVHGHTHHAVDYHVGHTRVISNPRGYVRDDWAERTGWVEDLVIEV